MSNLLWLLFPFMEFFVNGKNILKISPTIFLSISFLHCYSQVCSVSYIHFGSFCVTNFTQMPSLNRYEKVTCESCGNQTTTLNLARHKKSSSAGILFCIQCPNFCTKPQNDLNYHIAEKHSAPKLDVTFKCSLCYQDFPGFYSLRQHKDTQHGMQIGSQTRDVDVQNIVGDVDGQSLREELESCKHFLTDTKMENGRHRVFNFVMSSCDMSLLADKRDYLFKQMKCAAKVNLAFGFVLKNVEDGSCKCFYAHENNMIMERLKLVYTRRHYQPGREITENG